ncbi:restriction endonuclease subunit S [Geoalkalibacter sp.]|uniref:restriction endonuclease subunit S n=1 Tax=Geoalkalibacter sp. TaxID=3041440 RepID=UPI00272DE0B2|nr:restriction endonuclease subunit S [Geoalkalibacter sp.]
MKATDLLSTLPDSWQTVPIKTVCSYTVSNVDKHSLEDEMPVRLCNYTDVYKNDRVSPDLELMSATATEDEIDKFHLEAGDVVITKDSESWDDIGIPAYVEATADDFVCGYHLAFMRPNGYLLDGRFLFRCVQSRPVALQLELEATGVTRYGLPKGAIGNALIPLPSLETQRLIADYLDRETARIDALVAEKEKMLALLEEKRAALISRAVTRGLDPTAPLKPSGLDWLGDIPAHWEVLRLKFLVKGIDQGSSPQCYSYPAEVGQWGVLKTGCVNGGLFRENENKALPSHIDPCVVSEVQEDDVLMSRASGSADLIGSVAHVSAKPAARLLLSDKIYRLRLRPEKALPSYFVYALGADYVRHQIKAVISGAEGLANNIAKGDILEFSIVTPPVGEQFETALRLATEVSKSKSLGELLSESIAKLKERRATLITAAVTGQIPVEEMVL